MIQLLVDNPLLVFVLVAAIGYAVGQIKIGGTGLGIAAVLFVGLAFGALDPRLKLPDAFYLLGLVLFVYTIGLSSGPTFFRSLRRQGLRDILLCVGMLMLGAALLAALQRLLVLPPTVVAGLFAGSFTNTPALASVLDYIRTYAPTAARELLLSEPVVGYSAAYPLGVIGPMLVMLLLRRILAGRLRRRGRRAARAGTAQRAAPPPHHPRNPRRGHPAAAGQARRRQPLGCRLRPRAARPAACAGHRADLLCAGRPGRRRRHRRAPRPCCHAAGRGQRRAAGHRPPDAGLPAHLRLEPQRRRAPAERPASDGALWRHGDARATRR